MVQLEISFYGPFIYELLKDTLVVTAPRCPGHLASVQTDTDEKAMWGCGPAKTSTYQYVLKSRKGSYEAHTHTTCPDPESIILVEDWRKQRDKLEPSDYYFQLTLPRPLYCNPLIIDHIAYTEYDLPSCPDHPMDRKGTALRFYYTCFEESDCLELIDDQKCTLTTVHLTPLPNQTHIPVTFRYTANGIFDPDHQDAEECFMRMRALFPGLGAWTANFDSDNTEQCKRVPRTPILKLGSDCKAAAIMFMATEEKKAWGAKQVHEKPQME